MKELNIKNIANPSGGFLPVAMTKDKLVHFFFIAAFASGCAFSAIANPAVIKPSEVTPAELSHVMQTRWQTDAYRLGLTVDTFKFALDNYMRLVFDNHQPAIPLLSAVTANITSEAQLVQIMNKQRAEFANYLGIPVEILGDFEMLMPAYMPELSLPLNGEHNAQKPIERITVTCKDACGNKGSSSRDTLLLLDIYREATKAGIGQYTEFPVQMLSTDGSFLRAAVFKYNNFSGAWLVRDLPRCDTCALD